MKKLALCLALSALAVGCASTADGVDPASGIAESALDAERVSVAYEGSVDFDDATYRVRLEASYPKKVKVGATLVGAGETCRTLMRTSVPATFRVQLWKGETSLIDDASAAVVVYADSGRQSACTSPSDETFGARVSRAAGRHGEGEAAIFVGNVGAITLPGIVATYEPLAPAVPDEAGTQYSIADGELTLGAPSAKVDMAMYGSNVRLSRSNFVVEQQ